MLTDQNGLDIPGDFWHGTKFVPKHAQLVIGCCLVVNFPCTCTCYGYGVVGSTSKWNNQCTCK